MRPNVGRSPKGSATDEEDEMDRVLVFVKSAALWATIWGTVFFAINQYGRWKAGKLAFDVWIPITFIFFWVLALGFVMFVKMMRAARRFGWSLGRQVGKAPLGSAMQKATDDALGGGKKREPKV
jgi:drug/metabolite transporter (DMT)-like permease